METSLTAAELLDAMANARYYLVEGILDQEYPGINEVEALAVLTETIRKAGHELPSDIGRRVILNWNDQEGVITAAYNGYTVYLDDQGEIFSNEDDEPITEDDFTWADEVQA